MYGHALGRREPYFVPVVLSGEERSSPESRAAAQAHAAFFGPIQPGQTWTGYQTTQETLAKNMLVGAGVATAMMIHPLLGLAAGLGWLASK